MGESRHLTKSALGHIVPTEIAVTMAEAVNFARIASEPGDVVLLSPACSSFDAYDNYAHRGEAFCKEVKGQFNETE